jgi:hypothetical protein
VPSATTIRRPAAKRFSQAEALTLSVDELRAHRADVARADVGSLNATAGEGSEDDAVERVELLPSGDERSRPEHAAMIGDTKRAFRRRSTRCRRASRRSSSASTSSTSRCARSARCWA